MNAYSVTKHVSKEDGRCIDNVWIMINNAVSALCSACSCCTLLPTLQHAHQVAVHCLLHGTPCAVSEAATGTDAQTTERVSSRHFIIKEEREERREDLGLRVETLAAKGEMTWKLFQAWRMPAIKDEKPGLKSSQYRDHAKKDWQRSPMNPNNQIE